MNIRLNGKTALVCGSSQGIGKAIALQFSQLGAHVVLLARNEDLLRSTLKKLTKSSEQEHTYIQSDLNYPDKTLEKLSRFLNNRANIDIVVNNSGGPAPGKISDAESGELIAAFTQHVISSQMIARLLIPGMKKRAFGRIINIISIGAKQPIENLGISNTIRGAMASWGKTLSKELGPFGITVNNLLPGHTMTARLTALFENRAIAAGKTADEVMNDIKSLIPAGRFAKPEELAYAAAFLASDYAAFINGINLPVDGGFLNSL